MALRELLDVPAWAFELQMLYGMGDPMKLAALELGQRCRIYTPYGNLVNGMAYFIRRLLENTANESFLRMSSDDDANEELLLENPDLTGARTAPPTKPVVVRYEFEEVIMDPFENVANTDFSQAAGREQMQAGLAQVRAELGRAYPVWLAGVAVETGAWFDSVNPCQPAEVVAKIGRPSVETVEQAVAAARGAFAHWRQVPAFERADLIEQVGHRLGERRYELAALMALECGKTWREADADVSEAIDYCVYYAKEMRRIAEHPRRRDIEGETNEYEYLPRGVVAVISPWNFPLALLANMTVAAAVAGNTVVMKPASAASAVAGKFMDVITEVGVPAGVVNYLPGPGAEIGEALVQHPDVSGRDRLHGLARGRPADQPACRGGADAPAGAQARRRRDGRQERDHRRFRRRPGRGDQGRRGQRAELRRAEVLGRRARDRARQRARPLHGAAGRVGPVEDTRPGGRPDDGDPGADRRGRPRPGARVHRARQARGEMRAGGRAGRDGAGDGRLLRRPAYLRRRSARRAHRPGGDLRPGAVRACGRATSTRRSSCSTEPTTR
jgi:hypothetical protein